VSGSGTPTGSVTVTANAPGESCTGTVPDGFCSIIFTAPGERSVTATYDGDARFEGDSDTEEIEVAPAPPQNQAPNAVNDTYATPGSGQALTVDAPQGVLSNDSDPEATPLTAQAASDPDQGSVVLGSDGSFTYTPDSGATGQDTFTYQASDGSLTSAATVTITITP
jgi:VCBS repeat-containing protein